MKLSIKSISRTMAATLALAVMIPLGTMAASYDSIHTYRQDYTGQEYEIWSTIYEDSSTEYRGASWVHTSNSVNVPARAMGASVGLYSKGGEVYMELDPTFNSAPTTTHFRTTSDIYPYDGDVYAQGKIYLRNSASSDDYRFYLTAETRKLFPDSKSAETEYQDTLAQLADATLLSDGTYPVTASGETYGSELLANQVGEIPDLISAIGINGVSGYVRADEFYPNLKTAADVDAYVAAMEQNTAGYREIPVYDLNGNVIDRFHVLTTENEITDEIQATIDYLEQQDAIRNEEPPAHLAAQISKDFAGYPVNSKGETYGDQTMFSASGIEPDLRAAIGTNGEHGYIRTSDTISGKFTIGSRFDAEKYMEYMLTQPDSYLIPLYDKEGNVIGQFRYGGSGASDPIWQMRQDAQ